MNVKEKLQRCKTMVDSISAHEDEDAAVRHAILRELEQHIAEQHEAIKQRVADRLADLSKG